MQKIAELSQKLSFSKNLLYYALLNKDNEF